MAVALIVLIAFWGEGKREEDEAMKKELAGLPGQALLEDDDFCGKGEGQRFLQLLMSEGHSH